MKYLLSALLILLVISVHAHLNKTEKPKSYVFIFQNKDTVQLNNPSDSLLNAYSQYSIQHRKKLIKIHLTFAGGEILTFTNNKKKWTGISITDGRNEVAVPDSTLKKITEIHFAKVALVWSGNESRPFVTGYFYIRFDTGTEKIFNRYPQLKLVITNYKYSKAIILQPTEEREKSYVSEDF